MYIACTAFGLALLQFPELFIDPTAGSDSGIPKDAVEAYVKLIYSIVGGVLFCAFALSFVLAAAQLLGLQPRIDLYWIDERCCLPTNIPLLIFGFGETVDSGIWVTRPPNGRCLNDVCVLCVASCKFPYRICIWFGFGWIGRMDLGTWLHSDWGPACCCGVDQYCLRCRTDAVHSCLRCWVKIMLVIGILLTVCRIFFCPAACSRLLRHKNLARSTPMTWMRRWLETMARTWWGGVFATALDLPLAL